MIEHMNPERMNHGGSGSTYANYGCRCEECTDANTRRIKRRQAERYAAPKDPDGPRHGKTSFYINHGCRCDKCKAAQSVQNAQYRARRAALLKDRTP